MAAHPLPRLRQFGYGVRFGLAMLALTMLGGLIVSGIHLAWHYDSRDERPGLTMDDIRGAYHGTQFRAPLLTAVERGHPDDLPAEEREALLTWLQGNNIATDYDNFDLGDMAPAEIIGRSCLNCHSRQSTEGDGIYEKYPLDYYDDIKSIAFSRDIQPTPVEILAISTHTHAPSMAMIGFFAAILFVMSSMPRALVGLSVTVAGVGLVADVGGQWLTRQDEMFAWAIVIGGAMFSVSVGLMLGWCILELLVAPPLSVSDDDDD